MSDETLYYVQGTTSDGKDRHVAFHLTREQAFEVLCQAVRAGWRGLSIKEHP